VDPTRKYKFTLNNTDLKTTDNSHLFKNIIINRTSKDYENVIDSKVILIDKLFSDMNITKFNKSRIKLFYSTRCRDSKEIIIYNKIKLTDDVLRFFGLYQAEGSKGKGYYTSFGNETKSNVKFFLDILMNSIGFDLDDIYFELCIDNRYWQNKNFIRNYWAKYLGIKSNRIRCFISNLKISPFYGAMKIRLNNKTSKIFMFRLLDIIKWYVKSNVDACGNFISGLLAGDGSCTERKKSNGIKRIELSFNPYKLEDEGLFYLDCMKILKLKYFYVKIICRDIKKKDIAKQIYRSLKRRVKNVKLRFHKSKNSKGMGGIIVIHNKKDLQKLYKFELFKPHDYNHSKFYRCYINDPN
jgi:hypothetical protein